MSAEKIVVAVFAAAFLVLGFIGFWRWTAIQRFEQTAFPGYAFDRKTDVICDPWIPRVDSLTITKNNAGIPLCRSLR